MMENKKIVIVGGTGSWGLNLLEHLLKTDAVQIKVLARNEHNLVTLCRQFSDKRIQPLLCDIRDKTHLMQACEGMDILFHLAALKHVPVCEQMPTEAILTNVIGTQNVIDCAIRRNVEKVIYASTDKAVTPHCTYGCTKRLGEKLILAANARSQTTKFMVFRSGNLLGSSGSVIPLFKQQIAESGCVSLTDGRMNRFFIPRVQAAQLLAEAVVQGAGGEVFLPRMDALSIHDVAKYLLEKRGLGEAQIKISGIRPGETLDETMMTAEEHQSLCQISDRLYAVVGGGNRPWSANSFVKANNYTPCSKDAVLPYEQACAFLNAANI